eukprot:COSAG04_NODE_116_length_25104_cov_94.064907_14_plen_158_part_00
MDDAWVAAAQEAYDHVSADEEEVLVAVAGVGGPTNVFVTRGEGKTRPRSTVGCVRLTPMAAVAAHEGGLTAGLPLEDERCSPRLRGGNGAGGGKIREDLYGLPDPWNAPFRRSKMAMLSRFVARYVSLTWEASLYRSDRAPPSAPPARVDARPRLPR